MREVVEVLGLIFSTIRQTIDKGELYAIETAGGHRKIPKHELERVLDTKAHI